MTITSEYTREVVRRMFTLRGVKYKDILDISKLNIPEERITCIVGESGSGKTTLLRLLNHLISCDEGELCFQKTPLSLWNPIELRRRAKICDSNRGMIIGNSMTGISLGVKTLVEVKKLGQIIH